MKLSRILPLALLSACSLGTAPDAAPGSLKVLFIGNSLTYENDLPRTVAQLAASAGLAPCYCYELAFPNFSLEDHFFYSAAVNALQDESWDFVVMQQGPSALPSSRVNLIEWAEVFGGLIDENGAQAVMYAVWPQSDRPFDFPNVTESYRLAADAIGGLLAPAGEAWLWAWEADSTLPLYAADGFHPSTMGTYLAALTIFEQLYEHTPIGVQEEAVVDGRVQSWPAATVMLLQEAAAAANASARRESASIRDLDPAVNRRRN
ncbi:MAG TPA: hypothetical protein VFZ73_00095 [Gemmatimonadaceae bacterium]